VVEHVRQVDAQPQAHHGGVGGALGKHGQLQQEGARRWTPALIMLLADGLELVASVTALNIHGRQDTALCAMRLMLLLLMLVSGIRPYGRQASVQSRTARRSPRRGHCSTTACADRSAFSMDASQVRVTMAPARQRWPIIVA
jgi:hypothetical protein